MTERASWLVTNGRNSNNILSINVSINQRSDYDHRSVTEIWTVKITDRGF